MARTKKIVNEATVSDKIVVSDKVVVSEAVVINAFIGKEVAFVSEAVVINAGIGEEVAVVVVAKKRGRKSKKELQQILEQKQSVLANQADNITVSIEEADHICLIHNGLNTDLIDDLNDEINNDLNTNTNIGSVFLPEETPLKVGAKKRGRKPKGGKIIQQIVPLHNTMEPKPNIILHLKCSLKDLQSTTLLGGSVDSFNFSSCKNDFSFEVINSKDIPSSSNQHNLHSSVNVSNNENSKYENTKYENVKYEEDDCETSYAEDDGSKNKERDIKEVWKKLKTLEHSLHLNNISDKKSACFWCTCDFDNPPVYIPKHFIKDSYHVYGCFGSPECATAHLMEENIDSSTKFERYYLINHIYSKIYDYNKNIKPAPNPYYMLEKYYGNLSIQEFRSLFRSERLFLVVDKPLTRILPELHEDNDDFIINNKIIPSNTYQIKKKLQKKQQSKNTIVNEKFGLAAQQHY